jgi:hypothetical protein
MTDTYATREQVVARVSTAYTVPDDISAMLAKASELIDFATQGRAQLAWDDDPESTTSAAVTNAVADQIEFWLEVGEEHDVASLSGSLLGGRVQIQKLPPYLGRRPMRTLMAAGLYWAGTGVV